MTYNFGDSFDLYNQASIEAGNGYWDSFTSGSGPFISAGRFTGSRCIGWASNSNLVKSSNINDAVHHFVLAYQTTAAISGSTMGFNIQLFDGATVQCSIVWRSDGAICLTSGGPTGTVLATYTGAVTANNTWYAFECEVVINNTTGSFTVRKNGNNVNDFTLGGLNTRNSANNYANKIQIGSNAASVNNSYIDDFFWRSDAASVAWMGDIRCYTRMPNGDAQKVFQQSTSTLNMIFSGQSGAFSMPTNTCVAGQITAPYSGVLLGGYLISGGVATGNLKISLYSGDKTTLLATANTITSTPASGQQVPFTFAIPPSVSEGQTYWIAYNTDTGFAIQTSSSINTGIPALSGALAYASFPPANLTAIPVTTQNLIYMNLSFGTLTNASFVSEAQQDAYNSYVWDNNPGDADFYNIGTISSTPATVFATVVRGYMIKSDAGTRTAAVQLKSGSTTVSSPVVVLTTSGWQWAWRLDINNPATGAPWTAAAVNGAQIGPTVVA